MDAILERFAANSDVGHIALLFWALGASMLLSRALNEVTAANRRFDDFIMELARFNQRHGDVKT